MQQARAVETTEEREARLLQLRVSLEQRLAAETLEEREARLLQLRVGQQQRLAAETPQETEARRLRDRQNHMEPTSHEHPSVRTKMSKFHSTLAALQVSTCVTCMERFPGMTVRTTCGSTECARCSRDKHSSKAYILLRQQHASWSCSTGATGKYSSLLPLCHLLSAIC